MKIYTIDLTVNLLLLLVVLTHVTICNSESTSPSIVKLLHTNTHVCDFETPLKGSNHQLWLIWLQQLSSKARSIVCTRSPVVALKGFENSKSMYKTLPFELICKNML